MAAKNFDEWWLEKGQYGSINKIGCKIVWAAALEFAEGVRERAPNTRSLQLLLCDFKKDYPSLSEKTIHSINAFVIYAQQQQASA